MEISTAFVAGATGFTGRAVVEILCKRGVNTFAHVRPDSPSLDKWRESFSAIGAHIDTTSWDDEKKLAATINAISPGVVFSLLGSTRRRARLEGLPAKAAYETVDYGLTVRLLEAAEASSVKPRFVYLSALGADKGHGEYMKARKRAEERIRRSELPWIIARPSFITGKRDEPRRGEKLAATVSDTCLAALRRLGAGRLQDRYGSTSNRALADRLVELALDPAAAGGIFEGPLLTVG